jgi:hypothetical protein
LSDLGDNQLDDLEMSFQDIINIVSEWHDYEGLGPEESKLLSIFCAFIDQNITGFLDQYFAGETGEIAYGPYLSIMRIGLEAAFQLGRATGRDNHLLDPT